MIAVTGVNAVNPEGANQTTLQAAQLFGQLAQTQQRIAAQQAAQAFGATTDMMRMERQADLQMQQARDRAALNYGFESFDQLTQAAGEANQDVNTFLANLDADRQGVLAKQKLADDITRFQQTFPLELNADYVRNEAQATSAALQAEIGKRLPFAPPEIQARVRTLMSERQSIMADSAGFELRGLDDVAGDLRANANEIAQALAPVQVPVDPMTAYLQDPSYENGQRVIASRVIPTSFGGYLEITGERNGAVSTKYTPPEQISAPSTEEALADRLLRATPAERKQFTQELLDGLVGEVDGVPYRIKLKGLDISPVETGGRGGGRDPFDKIPLVEKGLEGERPLTVAERVAIGETMIETDEQLEAKQADRQLQKKVNKMTLSEATARTKELLAKLRSRPVTITEEERRELALIRDRAGDN